MAQITQKINLDVNKPNLFTSILAKQQDSNSRFLNVTLIGNNVKIEVLPTSTVTINAKRQDGASKRFAGSVNKDGTVTVPLTFWMLEKTGEVTSDVSIIGADGRKLTTTSFTIMVEQATCEDENITEDENYDVLVKLIEDVNKVKPDYFYDPTSEKAQSGIAVAEAINDFGNAIKGSASGEVVAIDDISPIEHTVKVNVKGENIDPSNVTLTMCGKNLVATNEFEVNKPAITWASANLDKIKIASGNYVASCNFKQVGTDKSQIALSIRDYDDYSIVLGGAVSVETSGKLVAPFTVKDGKKGFQVYVYSNMSAETLLADCIFTNIMVEAGNEATDYEAYKGKTYTPNANGNCDVVSVSPTMTLFTNTDGVTIECEYNKDTEKAIKEHSAMNGDGVVASPNADFAEVAEWSDGNPDNEDRIGYFVCFDVPTSGIIMRKANADDDVKGVTVANPSFAGNCTKDKFDENGKLLPQYEYVGVIGLVPVHDNGECVVGGRCVPADNGLAKPSPNDKGYQVVERYNDDMILIAIEPNGDMVYRLQEQIDKNGIKIIEEDVNAHELDYGIYIVDENKGACVSFLDGRFNDIMFTCDMFSGIIIVTPFWETDKMFTVSTYEVGAYIPVFFQTVYSGGEWLIDEYTHSYANTKYVDEQISSLQSQICEEKLFTFSFDELGEDILSKSIEKVDRWGVPCIKINFNLYTATKNADGTFTPYFDLPIEYMANPTLMADTNIKNLENFKSFAIKSPLVSNDFLSYELMRNLCVLNGYAKEFDIRIVNLNENGKVGFTVVWYILNGTETSRDYAYSNVFEPMFNSLTDFALKYENHKIPTVKPKKLI